jgi:hypothetical protein
MPHATDSTVNHRFRNEVAVAMCDALRPRQHVLAGWEGGSAAFDALDAYSDIDINFLVSTEASLDLLYAVAEAALRSVSPIVLTHIAPPGRYYKLEAGGPFLLVDVCFFPVGIQDLHLEVERHGQPRVLFDKGDWLLVPALNVDALAARCAARCAELRTWFPVSQSFVRKAIVRGQHVEALNAFWGYTLRPLGELLRMRYCPIRWDFGLRYLDRDLPADVYERFRSLLFTRNLDELEQNLESATEWGSALLAGFQVDAPLVEKRSSEGMTR